MIIFDSLLDALDEAAWCAKEERVLHYVFLIGEKYMVRKKHAGGLQPKKTHIEVGFHHKKAGRKPDA